MRARDQAALETEIRKLEEGHLEPRARASASGPASSVPTECSLRSSIWERCPSGWRLVFHQGSASGANP